ncbi:Uncharacterized protein HZ326_22163 [Fusarium oxysporum f. sp. albedinis]|nr:Uncharacterized protein HZ326_22163 [Fusarium oxysporum f. sp. albedinis]
MQFTQSDTAFSNGNITLKIRDKDNDLSDEDNLKMPSSPPCLLDRKSSLPTMPSTPCPPQHHARYDDAFINRIIEEAEALEATQALYDEQ